MGHCFGESALANNGPAGATKTWRLARREVHGGRVCEIGAAESSNLIGQWALLLDATRALHQIADQDKTW